MKAKNHIELKKANRAAILRLLLKHESISRRRLSELIGISSPTVTNIVNELIDFNLVREGNTIEPNLQGAGRKRRLIEINSKAKLVLAIDLGIPDSSVGIADLRGNIIKSDAIPASLISEPSAENILQIINLAKKLISSIKGSKKLIGVGIGFPDIPWGGVPIKSLFEQKFSVPVIVDNNVRAMTLGEYVFETHRDVNSMALLFIGRGIGSGLIINGNLWRGARGHAGNTIGHLPAGEPDLLKKNSDHGRLEYLTAQPAIAKRARKILPAFNEENDFSLVDILVDHALAGHQEACHLIQKVGQDLYTAVESLINIVDPELIVIAGRLAKAGDLLLDPIREVIQRRTLLGFEKDIQFKVWKAENSGLVGAAALTLMDQFYSSNFSLASDQSGHGVFGNQLIY